MFEHLVISVDDLSPIFMGSGCNNVTGPGVPKASPLATLKHPHSWVRKRKRIVNGRWCINVVRPDLENICFIVPGVLRHLGDWEGIAISLPTP